MTILSKITNKIKSGWEKTKDWIKSTTSKVVEKFRGLSIRDKILVGIAPVTYAGAAVVQKGASIVKKHIEAKLQSQPTNNPQGYTGMKTAAKSSPYAWIGLGALAFMFVK